MLFQNNLTDVREILTEKINTKLSSIKVDCNISHEVLQIDKDRSDVFNVISELSRMGKKYNKSILAMEHNNDTCDYLSKKISNICDTITTLAINEVNRYRDIIKSGVKSADELISIKQETDELKKDITKAQSNIFILIYITKRYFAKQ